MEDFDFADSQWIESENGHLARWLAKVVPILCQVGHCHDHDHDLKEYHDWMESLVGLHGWSYEWQVGFVSLMIQIFKKIQIFRFRFR
jgi:hypothetical protein